MLLLFHVFFLYLYVVVVVLALVLFSCYMLNITSRSAFSSFVIFGSRIGRVRSDFSSLFG